VISEFAPLTRRGISPVSATIAAAGTTLTVAVSSAAVMLPEAEAGITHNVAAKLSAMNWPLRGEKLTMAITPFDLDKRRNTTFWA
jgi:hypothetical protein